MDIYSFIPSRDIAEHCRTIGHEFTPLEIAVIIYHSKKNLAERHKAWQEIINTMPDTKVIEWAESKRKQKLYDSLHQFLQDYMQIESKLVDAFKTAEPCTVYTYRSLYNKGHGYYDTPTPYSTFDGVIKAVKSDFEINKANRDEQYYSEVRAYRIYKRWYDKENKYISVMVTSDGAILSDWENEDKTFEEADFDVLSAFDLISIYIPVPFNNGDILTYDRNKPFVLTDSEWNYGKKHSADERQYLAEGSIMDSIHGYEMREDGHVFWDFNPATLDLEYYRGDLIGLNRILKAISKHMKGEISADLMMNAYNIILHEEKLKQLWENMWYTDEGLALAGLEKKCE